MFRTTNVQNKWKIGPSESILFHFPPKTPLSAENVPALISAAERSAAPSPACTCSVRLPHDPAPFGSRVVPPGSCFVPFGSRFVPFSSHIVPPGSFVVPLGSRVAPFGSHIVPFSSHIVPPGSFVVPLGSRMIPPHPHAGTTATPLSRCPHPPLLFSRRSGSYSFRPAEPPRRPEQKNRLFFGVFVKFLLLLQHIAVTTLYPRRNGLHAASASLLTREFR